MAKQLAPALARHAEAADPLMQVLHARLVAVAEAGPRSVRATVNALLAATAPGFDPLAARRKAAGREAHLAGMAAPVVPPADGVTPMNLNLRWQRKEIRTALVRAENESVTEADRKVLHGLGTAMVEATQTDDNGRAYVAENLQTAWETFRTALQAPEQHSQLMTLKNDLISTLAQSRTSVA